MRLLHPGSMKESPSILAQRILCGPYFPLLISNGIWFSISQGEDSGPDDAVTAGVAGETSVLLLPQVVPAG